MRYKVVGLFIAFIFAVINLGVWAQQVPEGKVLVDEDVLLILVDEPGKHFHQARENFLKTDMIGASTSIVKGTAYLKMKTGRATEEGKKLLMDSIAELEKLASGVANGTVTSIKELDDTFARANYAMSKHHQLVAKESFSKDKTDNVGYDLAASTSYLERGYAWAGRELEAGTVTAINGTRTLAGKMIGLPGWVAGEAGAGVRVLGKATGTVIGFVGKGVGAVGAGAGGLVGGVGETTGKAVAGVGKGTGKVIEGVGDATGEITEDVGAGAGKVIEGVGAGTGKAVEAVGAGVAVVPEEVGKGISSLGKAIQKVGMKIKPKKQ
jgi:hypothetical protein